MSTPREQLAVSLKKSRLGAGFASQAAFAKRLHISRPVVTKAENPMQPVPTDAVLQAWAENAGTDPAELQELAQRCKSGTPEWFVPYRQAEASAQILRYWSPIVVPGPAQTTAYMRALFGDEGHPLDKIDELVTTRTERQQVIGRVPTTLIISRHVLYRLVGSAAVMAEQCAHLARIAELPGVGVHVLPENVSAGSYGAFDIATGDGTATVRLEAVEDVTSTNPDLLGKTSVAFERLLGAAAPRGDSLGTIRTAEGSWKERI